MSEAVFSKEFVLCFLVVYYIYGAFVILDVNKSTISIDTFIFGYGADATLDAKHLP